MATPVPPYYLSLRWRPSNKFTQEVWKQQSTQVSTTLGRLSYGFTLQYKRSCIVFVQNSQYIFKVIAEECTCCCSLSQNPPRQRKNSSCIIYYISIDTARCMWTVLISPCCIPLYRLQCSVLIFLRMMFYNAQDVLALGSVCQYGLKQTHFLAWRTWHKLNASTYSKGALTQSGHSVSNATQPWWYYWATLTQPIMQTMG